MKVTAETIYSNLNYQPQPVEPNFLQNEEGWKMVETPGIQSNDVTTVFHCGYIPLRTMVQRKAGLLPKTKWEGNKYAYRIKRGMKDIILESLGEYFGLQDVERNVAYNRHPLYPFMLSKPDGKVKMPCTDEIGSPMVDENGEMIEQLYVINIHLINADSVKGEDGWLRWSEEEHTYVNQIPFSAELRARHDAAVFNAAGAIVIGVPIGSDSPESWYINRLERDAEKEAAIINEENLVWHMIEEQNPPEYYYPEGSDMVAKAFLAEKALPAGNSATPDLIPLSAEIETAMSKLDEIAKKLKLLKQEEEKLKQEYVEAAMPITMSMHSTESVIDGTGKKASFTIRTTTGISKDALQKLKITKPAMYNCLVEEGYIKSNSSQTTRVKISAYSEKNAAKKQKQKG